MIHEAIVVLTVLGCGDEARDCNFLPDQEAVYQSVSQCEAAIPALLKRTEDAPYPLLTASCDVKIVETGVNVAAAPPVTIATNNSASMQGQGDDLLVSEVVPIAADKQSDGPYGAVLNGAAGIVTTSAHTAVAGYNGMKVRVRDGIGVSIDATARAAKGATKLVTYVAGPFSF